MRILFLIVFFLISGHSIVFSQNVSVLRYWTFEGEDLLKDIKAGKRMNTTDYQCGVSRVRSKVGMGINMERKACLNTTTWLKENATNEFSIEFLFKGSQFHYLTFGQQYLNIGFSYPTIHFRSTVSNSLAKDGTELLVVELNKTGSASYDYYTDGNWHHFVFSASTLTGKMEVWVDGELREDFKKEIPKGGNFIFGSNDGFRDTDMIDELAFYNIAISPELIWQHFVETNDGKPYSFSLKKGLSSVPRKLSDEIHGIDRMEFAPGYPDYNVQATDQLKSFPLPRYRTSVPIKRNMSWMDIGYLHRELPGDGGKGFGGVNSRKAVELSEEMAKNWNYYVDLPVLRTTAEGAAKQYNDINTIDGALIDFVNKNPQYPSSSILLEAQIKPIHAGFEAASAYATAQDLPLEYYLRDAEGIPIIYNKKKWLSPLMPLDIIQKDGRTSRFYLDQILKHLHRPPMLINENGEIFGHIRKELLLKNDPIVWKHYQKSGLTESQYSGWFQSRIDSVYRAAVMEGLDPQKTYFSFYNLSALNPEYWPDYQMRRNLNLWNKDTVYSTPDFYPRTPNNWRNVGGAFNGYGPIARGRLKEIALGDRFFSPFVSAGWGKEENNIRPAQWLALLKAMVMLGAEFFYTGYFNVTGSQGQWPDGAGPNDPRGYAYQIAMPTYAQAVRTWVPEFFDKGELLNPASSGDIIRQFRFIGGGENELLLVRKSEKKYLIYGSIQPNSNIRGNVPQDKRTTIDLEGNKISFLINRQGCMYILDLTDKEPIFYQLDGWHQYEYPYYWSDTIKIEAENADKIFRTSIRTRKIQKEAFDFSEFQTFAELKPESSISFLIPRKRSGYNCNINLRSSSAVSRLRISCGEKQITKRISFKDWSTLRLTKQEVESLNLREGSTIKILGISGVAEVDGVSF